MAQEPPQLKEAYEVYYKLSQFPLFEDEENNIRLKQALVLLLLGDTNKAKPIFERTRQKADQRKYYECLYLQSLFDERGGEFEKARQNLLSAASEHDDVKDLQLAIIYNNLGRMDKVIGNMTNVLHYYRKSAEYARHFKEKHLIHVVYPNIIDICLLLDDRRNARVFLDTYAGLIDEDNIDDRLQFHNYMLAYARQTENRTLLLQTLDKGRLEILPRISATELLCFEVAELRIRWSHQCDWQERLLWMRNNLPKYLELEFPLRYHLIKEVFNILYDLAKKNYLGLECTPMIGQVGLGESGGVTPYLGRC
jgi:tetratricopeptide (TPR) repeat protein